MFFERLEKACAYKGIKMTPLVKELGLSSGNVSNWKRGVIPNGKIIQMLADKLEVSTSWLLGENEPLPPKMVEAFVKRYEILNDDDKEKVIEYIEFLISRQNKKREKANHSEV